MKFVPWNVIFLFAIDFRRVHTIDLKILNESSTNKRDAKMPKGFFNNHLQVGKFWHILQGNLLSIVNLHDLFVRSLLNFGSLGKNLKYPGSSCGCCYWALE